VFEFGQDAGRPFMALELLSGGTLSERLKSAGRFDPWEAARLVAKLAGAVQTAHDLGIVHRDLKPSNVLFDDRGEPKVTDFGLAKRAGGADLTHTQAVMGTPAYMAPEQARGDTKFVGPAADVWALGAILYECLTGKRPFEAEDTWAVLRKVTDEAPPRLRSHVPGLPRDLELIALKCLEKKPADRYPSAAALADDLHRFVEGKPVSVRPAGPSERFVKWCRRNPVVAGFTAALVLVALLGFAGVTWAFLKAEERGKDLANANGELSRTNGDLTKSRNELDDANKDLSHMSAQLLELINRLTKSRDDLEKAEAEALERSYLSNIALAQQLWKANDISGMRAALARCQPDRMRWEWDYLRGLTKPEIAVYPTDSLPIALQYSPNGKLLAFMTMSGSLEVRNLKLGKDEFKHSPEGVVDRYGALAFRPDGKELAFSSGAQLNLLDLETWKLKDLPTKKDAKPHNYIALGYTKDSLLLGAILTRGETEDKHNITIRDVFADKVIATLPGWETPKSVVAELAGVAFSPDASRFAANVSDTGIRISRKEDGPAKFEFFRPIVLMWDIGTARTLAQVEGGSSLLGSVTFSADSQSIGFGGRGRVWELEPLERGLQLRPGHTGEVLAVAFDRNGLIWSGGEDKLIRGNDRATGAEQFVIRGCPNGVVRLAASPDGKEIAVATGEVLGNEGGIRRYDVAAMGADVWRVQTGRDHVSLVNALSADGIRFAVCDFPLDKNALLGPRFKFRNTFEGKEQECAVESPGIWMRGSFRPDGSAVMLTEGGEKIQIIEADGKLGREIPINPLSTPGTLPFVSCTPDGKTLAAVTLHGEPRPAALPFHAQLKTWDAATLKPGLAVKSDLSEVFPPKADSQFVYPTGGAFDPEGRRLAVTFLAAWQQTKGRNRLETQGFVVVWDVATGKELFRKLTKEPLRAAGFDPEDHLVVAGGGSSSGMVLGWDLETGAEVLSLRGHTRPILCFAFGPGGRLATGGADRVVKVWDVASSRELLTLDGFAREVTHVAFTKDGANLVAATGVDLMTAIMMPGRPTDWPAAEVRIFRGPR
jgi:eukaryotic-like serine/threonine-protein kinase